MTPTRPVTPPLTTLGEAGLGRVLTGSVAVDALERALRDGFDPATTPARSVVEVPGGQLLLMPAAVPGFAGVKVAGVAPGNPDRGLARIQGAYLLMDGATLAVLAVLDGPSLTVARTAATSALAARHLADPEARRLVVFGAGPQAWGHVRELRRAMPLTHVVVVGRDAGRAGSLVARCQGVGLVARAGTPDDVARADVVACCTSARTPVFAGNLLADHTLVVAVGSHEPTAREVDSAAMARARVVVEDVTTSLREAGDVVMAIADGALDAGDLLSLADVVTGRIPPHTGRPTVFKSVGMAWQDLLVAVAAYGLAT